MYRWSERQNILHKGGDGKKKMMEIAMMNDKTLNIFK
jgi:hypothetical protein